MIFNDGQGDDIVMWGGDNNGKMYTFGFALMGGILISRGGSSRRD